MGLVGFMKLSDPNRISTITPDIHDRHRARKLYVPKSALGKSVYEKIYVADCQTHIGGVSVSVELMQYVSPGEWKSIGIAKCCPLCWRVLISPTGEREPEVKPLTVEDVEPSSTSKTVLLPKKSASTKNPNGGSTTLSLKVLALWARKLDEFSVYEVMSSFNISRPRTVPILKLGVKAGLLEEKIGAGRGQKTTYRLVRK